MRTVKGGMNFRLPTRMLNPARRWALRELKVHPGQTVIVAGCPTAWTVDVLRELVTDTGAMIVVNSPAHEAALPSHADRLLLDDQDVFADAGALARILAPLGPGARVAAVCRRGDAGGLCPLEAKVPILRRESFYFGAAFVVWGQIP